MSVETEIKLEFLSELSDRAMRHAVRQAIAEDLPRAVTRRLRSIYFDTLEHALAARGISLRLRCNNAHWVQTLKSPTKGGVGLQTYAEDEVQLPEEKLDLSLFPGRSPSLKWLSTIVDDLRPVFETDIRRTTWLVRAGDNEIELAWDIGHIRANTRALPINELELELKRGTPSALFEMARKLAQALPVRPGHATKAERGMRLATGQMPAAQSASVAELKREDMADEAFRKVASQCLSQMFANESAVLAAGAPDAIHQFRVALRRLRAAINICRNLIDEEVYSRWREELKWLHQAFGRVRDLDVFMSRTMRRLSKQYKSEPTLGRIEEAAREARKAALEAANLALGSRRYALIAIDMPHTLSGDRWKLQSEEPKAEIPAAEFAARQMKKRYKRVRALGDRWPDLDIDDLHRLRILVKKLRYTALAFSSLFPTKATRPFLVALETLQDCLGVLNDNSVGQKYANELAASIDGGTVVSPEMERTLSIISGWHSRGIQDSQENFEACWLAFVKGKRYWKG